MIRSRYRSRALLFLAIADALILAISFQYGVVESWVLVNSPADLVPLIPKTVLFAAVLMGMMFALGLYQAEYLLSTSTVVARVLVAFALAGPLFAFLFYALPITVIWRSVMFPALVASLVGVTMSRFAMARLIDHERWKRRIVVVGAGRLAREIGALAERSRTSSFQCFGYIDLGNEETLVARKQLIEMPARLSEYARANGISEVVVASSDWRNSIPMPQLLECKLAGQRVSDYLTFFQSETGAVDLDAVRAGWFIFSRQHSDGTLRKAVKRSFDLSIATILLILLLPLVCLIAVAIRLETSGPIIYKQFRIGLLGQPFKLLKFRTMAVDAEGDGIPKWADKNDVRITKLGRFLRRTRLDEIPQLINVVLGDMSIVGPRPEREYFVNELAKQLPFYEERHRIKPGLTGWAQLNYPYGASVSDARAKLQYDLYYLNYRTLVLDILILIQTLRVVLWPEGAR